MQHGPASLPERLVGGAEIIRNATDRRYFLYGRLKLLPELIERRPIPERQTKLREYRFRLGFGDKVSDSDLLSDDAPPFTSGSEPLKTALATCGS